MKNNILSKITVALLILGTIYFVLLLYFTPGLMTMYTNMFGNTDAIREAYSGWAFLLTIITFVVLLMIPLNTFQAANKLSKYNNRIMHYEDFGLSRAFMYVGGLVVLGIYANREIKKEIKEFDELVAERNAQVTA